VNGSKFESHGDYAIPPDDGAVPVIDENGHLKRLAVSLQLAHDSGFVSGLETALTLPWRELSKAWNM